MFRYFIEPCFWAILILLRVCPPYFDIQIKCKTINSNFVKGKKPTIHFKKIAIFLQIGIALIVYNQSTNYPSKPVTRQT